MLQPIRYPQRRAFGPAILFALVAEPTVLVVLETFSLTARTPDPVKPINSVQITRLETYSSPTKARSAKHDITSAPWKAQATDPAALERTVRQATTPPSQISALRSEFVRYRNDGLALKSTFTLLVTINQDWLGFLRAYGAQLVMSHYMPSPGSPVLIYSIEDGTLSDDYMPVGTVVRSVDGDVPIPGFSIVLRKAAVELGHQPSLFVLYRSDVFWAMQGKAAAELRAHHLDPDQVSILQVRYVPTGDDYDIAVERVIRGNER